MNIVLDISRPYVLLSIERELTYTRPKHLFAANSPNLTIRMDATLYDRFNESTLQEAPVVLIHGSRQCGKTTLAQTVGEKLGYHYINFDDDNQLQAAKVDPVGFIQNLPQRTILDEIQRTPELFTSIKASVDKNRKPGRFILTAISKTSIKISIFLKWLNESFHLLHKGKLLNDKSNRKISLMGVLVL